jgi:hypothetical protein
VGHYSRQVSANTTRYYWYPGDKREWYRALTAVAVGVSLSIAFVLLRCGILAATVIGASATVLLAGVNFGRRDARALAQVPDPGLSPRRARRAALGYSGRAAWRALAQGAGCAFAAVLVANLPARGVLADWVLPLVPGIAGALGHQMGLLAGRMVRVSSAPSAGDRRRRLVPARPTV